jgi:hypothetical protein
MVNFTGYIESGGVVKYRNVSGSYSISTSRGGMKSWSGSLKILSGETPELTDGVLYMNDGKKGNIMITKFNLPSGPILFQGNGPIE